MTHYNMDTMLHHLRRKALDPQEKEALWANIESRRGVLSISRPIHRNRNRQTLMSIAASGAAMVIFTAIAYSALHVKSGSTLTGAQPATQHIHTRTGESALESSGMGNFNNWFGDQGLQYGAQHGFETSLVQSQTDHGITLTIRDVVYDQARLAFRWVSNGKEAGGIGFGPNGIHLFVNGHLYKSASFQAFGPSRFFGPNHANGMIEISPNRPLPQRFVLGISDHAVGNVRGRWNFHIPVSRIKSDSATKTYHVNLTKTYHQMTVNLETIIVTPTTLVIDGSVSTPTNRSPMELGLLNKDGRISPPLPGQYEHWKSRGKRTTVQYRFEYSLRGTSLKQITVVPYGMSSPAVFEEKPGIRVDLAPTRHA